MKYHESGRPPGALSSSNGPSRRRRTTTGPLQQEWELRDRYYQQQQYCVEELESDEDEEGVVLQSMQHALERDRTPTRQRELMYHGNSIMRVEGAFDQDYYFSDEEQHYSPPTMRERELERERDDMLVQSAYARIARAREKGKTNVNLTPEEMQALDRQRMGEGRRTSGQQAPERRTIQLPEPSAAIATPPITPAAAISSKAKDKVKASSSRSSSATSLASQKKSGKKGSSLLNSSPAKGNPKGKVMRKGSVHLDQPPIMEPLPQAPPGMRLVNGPHGVPVYAPYDYPPLAAQGSPAASRSRPGSQHRRKDSVTPPREYPPTSISTRYRPGSSSSLRDDGGLDMPYDLYPGRHRSMSNARSHQNMPPYGGYEHERPTSRQEHYVEPVRYASLRRMPQPISNLSRDGPLQRVHTNGSSESSGGEEQGVRVEVSATAGGGYTVRREEEAEPVDERKEKVKGKDLGKYGSVRKKKGKR